MSNQPKLPFFRESGEGDTTIFMFHGAYGDGRYFEKLSDHLVAQGYRTVVWDCPGYGVSPSLEVSTVETFGDAATYLVDELGTDKNVIFGHSMGSLIAPRAVIQSKMNIVGAILSATSPGFKARTPEDQKRFLDERLLPIQEGMSVGEYAPKLLREMMGEGAAGSEVDNVIRVVSEMDTDVFERSLIALTQYDGRPTLQEVNVPVLLIAGEKDTACPPAGMKIVHDLLPNSNYEELEGVGHYGFAEKFDDYARLVDSFLDDLSQNGVN